MIELANPPLNLLSEELLEDLADAVRAATADHVRALVLMAQGKNFSGGADVHMFLGLSRAEARVVFLRWLPIVSELERSPFPTMAVVRGACCAGGLELALACDLIWAGETARFAQSETSIGTAPLFGGAQRLAERAGPARAREIVFSAGFYDAATFERWNIVNRILPDDRLQDTALEYAGRLASGPTLAFAASKRLIRAHLDHGVRGADDLINDVALPLFDTEDMQNGVSTLIDVGPQRLSERVEYRGR